METTVDILSRAPCYTGHAFGMLSVPCIPRQDMPRNFYRNSRFSVSKGFRGGSGVISPFGEYIAGPVYDEETIAYADIDLSDADKGRDAVNLTGINSRWDLININVRQEPCESLVSREPVERPASESKRINDLEACVKQLEQKIAKLSSDTRINI